MLYSCLPGPSRPPQKLEYTCLLHQLQAPSWRAGNDRSWPTWRAAVQSWSCCTLLQKWLPLPLSSHAFQVYALAACCLTWLWMRLTASPSGDMTSDQTTSNWGNCALSYLVLPAWLWQQQQLRMYKRTLCSPCDCGCLCFLLRRFSAVTCTMTWSIFRELLPNPYVHLYDFIKKALALASGSSEQVGKLHCEIFAGFFWSRIIFHKITRVNYNKLVNSVFCSKAK